ncbi:MAG TPA: hypothetical protein VGN00_20285 [Puia sp.]|jgi:transcriptional regulator with XRE-family HTH domain
MSRPVDDARILRFKQDRLLLACNDIDIARRMNISNASYSSYITGRYPITYKFLNRFYAAFAEEVKTISDKQKAENNFAIEPQDLKVSLEAIKDEYKLLSIKYDSISHSQQEISANMLRLESKVDRILGRLARLKTMLASVVTQITKFVQKNKAKRIL